MARVEIAQTGLLFSAQGQTRQLTARAFDAAGQAVATTFDWSATDPVDIAVDENGVARAVSASGSGQIVAQVGEVRSPPLLAVVTEMPASTLLIDDAQVVAGPQADVPDAAPDFDNTYSVVISGIAPPPLDSLMVGTGSVPLAGRVVNTEVVAAGVRVTLALAAADELFPELEINQTFDLGEVAPVFPQEIAEDFDITRDGNRYRFVSRPQEQPEGRVAKVAVPVGTRVIQNNCSVESATFQGESPPITFARPLDFDIDIRPSLQVVYTRGRGLERFVVGAAPRFQLDAEPQLTLVLDGKVSCKFELILIPVPVGGPISLIIGGVVPVGVGFELGGKLTVAQASFRLQTTVSNTLAAGFVCSFGACDPLTEFGTFDVQSQTTFNAPGLDDLRLEPSLELFGYAEAAIGNRFLKSIRFSALEAKLGAKLSGKFALPISQILAADFKASYDLKLAAGIKPGKEISSVLKVLGLSSLGEDGLSVETTLADSPVGALEADRSDFQAGDPVTLTVTLDPDKIRFLGIDNIGEIQIIERRSDTNAVIVGRQAAVPGQTRFQFDLVATEAGRTDSFFAFVRTSLAPVDLLALELGPAQASSTLIRRTHAETFVFVIDCDDDTCFDRTQNQRIKFLQSDADQAPVAEEVVDELQFSGPVFARARAGTEVATESSTGRTTITQRCNVSSQSGDIGGGTAESATAHFVTFEVPDNTTMSYQIVPPEIFPPREFSEGRFNAVALIPEGDDLPGADESYYGSQFRLTLFNPSSPSVGLARYLRSANDSIGSEQGTLEPGRYAMVLECGALAATAPSQGGVTSAFSFDDAATLTLQPITGASVP